MGSGDIPTGTPSGYFAGLFLLLSYVASHLEAEVTAIWGAPVLFTVAVAVVGFLIWGAHRYRHGRRLDEIPILHSQLTAKDGDLRRKDEEIKKLTELLKEATEQKQIEPAKPIIKIYNTPSNPNEIIHPSPNGPLWRWDSTTGALGPFCPNHQQQRLGLKRENESGIRLKDFEKEYLSFNWFTCPLDDSEDFKFLKQHALRVHELRTQATDRFRSGYGQKDHVTSWSGVLEIKRLNSEVQWRDANGKDFRSLTDELPYGANLFLAIQVEITANPPRLVESILLNFAGNTIDEWDWAPKLIDKQEFFLYFKLRAPIAFGKQTVFFVAKGLGPEATLMEKRFESFEVIIARSYAELQNLSGTPHQKAAALESKSEETSGQTEPKVTCLVHGIPLALRIEKRVILFIPEVTITNSSYTRTVSIEVELLVSMSGGGFFVFPSESTPIKEWEQSPQSAKNRCLIFPLNLPPEHAAGGYIAFGTDRLRGIDNAPDFKNCKVEFKNLHTQQVIHSEAIRFIINI